MSDTHVSTGVSGEEAGKGPTLASACRATREALTQGGIPGAALNARVLVCAAAGATLETLVAYPETPVDAGAVARLRDMTSARLARCPVSRILGEREFWSRTFTVTPAVLDPRADSEILVAAALEHLSSSPVGTPSILDIGTGSGCLIVTLLCETSRATGVALDRDEEALAVARANARRHGVESRCGFVCGDWTASLHGQFDCIVSNPPYIKSQAIEDLEPEVRKFDPWQALDGGRDGLDAYRRIAADARRLLRPGGVLGFEIGQGQQEDVAGILQRSGLEKVSFRNDLSGIVRCVFATVPPI